jgi:predicted nucleic acid-binding protein
MTERLIDTNILVYAYDVSETTKHPIARDLLTQIWKTGGGVVCVQNLMEFFVVMTRKVAAPIPVSEAKTIIDDMVRSDRWKVIDRDVHTFLDAIDLVSQYHIHIWDAAITACMKENGVTDIVTEDNADFEKIPGIHVMVPFASEGQKVACSHGA